MEAAFNRLVSAIEADKDIMSIFVETDSATGDLMYGADGVFGGTDADTYRFGLTHDEIESMIKGYIDDLFDKGATTTLSIFGNDGYTEHKDFTAEEARHLNAGVIYALLADARGTDGFIEGDAQDTADTEANAYFTSHKDEIFTVFATRMANILANRERNTFEQVTDTTHTY